MPPSSKPLELDAGQMFRRSFLVIFVVMEWVIWQRVGRLRPLRMRGRRVPLLGLMFGITWRSAFVALMLAGAITLSAMLVVRLILSPLLNLWLRPPFDASEWTFHLSAGETASAGVPARWRSLGRWRPGALVLTKRRICFIPAAWGMEPWSMALDDLERIEAEPPILARLLPVHNWPDLLRFTDRTGDRASFAVADPDEVMDWFSPPRQPHDAPPSTRVAPQGVFDV
jgi:hypothetical protein